jgi:hypothetical protein
MAIDDEVWKGTRTSLDGGLERAEQLRSHLRQSLDLAEALLAEQRAGPYAQESITLGDSPGGTPGSASEVHALRARVRDLAHALEHEEARARNAEQDLSDVANTYIASSQLHIGLRPEGVVGQVREMMGQLVGAECFVIYVLADDLHTALPVSYEGIAFSALSPARVGQGAVGQVLADGELYMRLETPLPHGTLDQPLAVIPMLVAGKAIGAVSVLRLLPQKSGWSAVDHELFRLLSHQAGSALLTAHLYQQKSDLQSALAGLGESLV